MSNRCRPRVWLVVGIGVALSGCLDWLPSPDPPPSVPPPPNRTTPDRGTDAGPVGADVAPTGNRTAPSLNPQSFPPIQGALALGNETGKDRVIRIRSLLPSVRLDCKSVTSAPAAMLSKALFSGAKAWLLPPGRAMPIDAPAMVGGSCRTLLIDGTDLPLHILFWDASEWPATSMPSTVNGAAPGRLVRLVDVEGSIELGAHDAVFGGPGTIDPPVAPACKLPGEDAALAWAEPAPTGALEITSRVDAPDGCMALGLKTGQGPATWYLCLPVGSFPFEVGDQVYAQVLLGGHGDGPVKGMQWQAQDDGRLLRFGIGGEPVLFDGGAAKVERVPGCAGQHDDCGTLSLPLRVVVSGDAQADNVASGGQLAVGAGVVRVVRARELPAMNKACLAAAPAGLIRIETVWTVSAK